MLTHNLRVNGRTITEPVARLYTARNWRRYQRCERTRQRVIRWSILLLVSLCALGFLLFK